MNIKQEKDTYGSKLSNFKISLSYIGRGAKTISIFGSL